MTEQTPIPKSDLELFNIDRTRHRYSKREVIESLKLFSEYIGGKPTSRAAYKNWSHKLVSPEVIYVMFGSWEEACRQAGVPLPGKKHRYLDRDLIEHMEKVWRYFERRPIERDLNQYNKIFGTTINRCVYRRRWGSFASFTKKLGQYKLGLITYEELAKRANDNRRTAIPARLRAEVLLRDNYTCRDCGVSPRNSKRVKLEVHHIIPFSKGGETTMDNLVTNCKLCNVGKSDCIIQTDLLVD